MNASTFSEPLTPRGVAAFARAGLSRLLLAQFIVALLAASTVVWFLHSSCFPTVRAAIRQLPASGAIDSGKLDWRGGSPQLLAEGKILAFDVDLKHAGQIHSPADVQIEFGRDSIRIYSLFGYTDFFYVADRTSPFNRTDLEPLWGAWAAEILFLAGAAVIVGLLSGWWLLATIYFLPAWTFGFFANRELDFRASWKLSGAALLPGALLVAVSVWLYGFGFLNLVSFGFIFAAHFVLGWIYLFVSQLFLPRSLELPPKSNPFKPA